MGISMTIVQVSDDDLRRYKASPLELAHRMNREARGAQSCQLGDTWDGVHHLIARPGERQRLPMAALRVGDITFRLDDPTHALRSKTTAALAAALGVLPKQTALERFDALMRETGTLRGVAGRMRGGFARGASRESHQRSFDELYAGVQALTRFATEAATRKMGLVFQQWEDW